MSDVDCATPRRRLYENGESRWLNMILDSLGRLTQARLAELCRQGMV